MPTPKNIAAWTPTKYEQAAPFVSINRTGDYDALVQISVRAEKKHDGSGGEYATVVMTKEEFALLLLRAGREV